MRGYSASLWLTFAVVLSLHLCSSQTKAQGFDWDSYNAMSKQDRLTIVLAGLRERSAPFSNVEIAMVASCVSTEIDSDKKPQPSVMVETRTNLRWLRGAFYYDADLDVSSERPSSVPRNEKGMRAWNGQVHKAWSRLPGNTEGKGVIEAAEPKASGALLSELAGFLEMAGLRFGAIPTMTVADYLQNVETKAGMEWTVERAGEGKDGHIKLAYWDAYQHRNEYVFDPNRAFLIMKHDTFDERGHIMSDVTEEAKLIQGNWVPWKYRQIRTFPSSKMRTTFELSNCQFGSVEPDQLTFEFPSGTRYSDRINGGVHLISNDGQVAQVPSINSLTGKITMPPATAPSGSVAATPAPENLALVPSTESHGYRRWTIALGSIALLGLGLGVALRYRKRAI